MNEYKLTKNVVIVIIAIALIGPPILVMYNPTLGAIALFAGLITIIRSLRYLRYIERQDHQETDRHALRRQDQGRTVYVSLLDEAGVPLDEAAAAARINKARLLAGPRDTVIGVKRQV